MGVNKIGILGGSFNPIHLGHIQMAFYAQKEMGLSKILFIPTGNPPHKALPPGEIRYDMLNFALLGLEKYGFEASPIEINKPGTTYTIDTLRELHETCGSAAFYFIIGEDTLYEIDKWRESKEIFKLCEFLVIPRPIPNKNNAQREAMAARLAAMGAKIIFMHSPPNHISSTRIRGAYESKKVNYWPELNSWLSDIQTPEGYINLPGLKTVDAFIHIAGLYGAAKPYDQAMAHYNILKGLLGIARLSHSISVMATARALALRYSIDPIKAGMAGLLHDCAKELGIAPMHALCEAYAIPLDEEESRLPALLHGPAGACCVQNMFDVYDTEILSAIACHTVGKANMSLLDLIVFLADKIEPTRAPYEALYKMRTLAAIDLRQAVAYTIQCNIDYLNAKKRPIAKKTYETLHWLET